MEKIKVKPIGGQVPVYKVKEGAFKRKLLGKRFLATGIIIASLIYAADYSYKRGLDDGIVQVQQEIIDQQRQQLAADPRAAFTRDNILIRFNEERLQARLPQVTEVIELNDLAQERAESIATGQTSYSHDGFREMVKKNKIIRDWQIGELLASGSETATQTIKSLMSSPTHRDIILSPEVCAVGIGLSTGQMLKNVAVILLVENCLQD